MEVMLFIVNDVAMFAPHFNYLLWALIAEGFQMGADIVFEPGNVLEEM